MVRVTVKWQKNSYDVDVDTTEPPAMFKFQLYSLTAVPPERQKIMVKGGTLKDDTDWAKVDLKEGQKLMMMGTADKVPEAPKEALVFMEDLPEDEQDVTGLGKYGAGLQNLGNTCYMNSTVQCLYAIPELRQSLHDLGSSAQGLNTGSRTLALAAKNLFANLERSAEPVLPMQFLLQLRQHYPQFAQQTNTGLYMQQDAEECWTNLVYSLKEALQGSDPADAAASDPVINRLMGVGLHTQLTCEDSGESIQEDSTAFQLKCNITVDVNHLSEGLKLGLQDDREKNSEQLQRLALFKGSSKITRLPPYLTVQLVRFFYKRDVQQKSKILRKVNFPLVLDCYEFCSAEYKRELDGPREAMKLVEDRKAGIAKQKRASECKAAEEKEQAEKEANKKRPLSKVSAAKAEPEKQANASTAGPSGDVEMKDDDETSSSGVDVSAHVGKQTGRYELVAVLTHKGRSADSGHYVSWAKQPDKSWIQFDDEQMIPRKEEEITELSGGGDWHMAYLLLYSAIKVTAE